MKGTNQVDDSHFCTPLEEFSESHSEGNLDGNHLIEARGVENLDYPLLACSHMTCFTPIMVA